MVNPELLPAIEAEEEFLTQTAGEIRGYGKLVAAGIIEIGRKLVEAKERVRHGRYTAFVTETLGWSEQAGRNFVAVFEMSKSPKFGGLEGLTIDASSLYKLAAPSTPAEARDEVLAKAAEPGGVSREEVDRIVTAAREAERRAAVETVAARVSELTEQFNSDVEAVKADAIRQLGVLRGEIDKYKAEHDAAEPGPPTLRDAVAMLLKLTGKKKLSDDQYQGLACALESPIAAGNKTYPPVTHEASRAADEDLKTSSACSRVLEYFVTAPPAAEVVRSMPEWLRGKTATLLPAVRPWLDDLQTSIEGPGAPAVTGCGTGKGNRTRRTAVASSTPPRLAVGSAEIVAPETGGAN